VRDGHAQPPIQEDETAITLLTLGEHYKVSRDVEYIEDLYNSYIKRAADFLARYRDKKTGLPLPSHDLWEERFGVFTYTASTVFAALETASYFAKLLGKEVASRRWHSVAEEVKRGILAELVREDGTILKSLAYDHASPEPDLTVDASSFYGLYKFGVLAPEDERLQRGYERVKEALTVGADRVGIARYVGDNYFRVHPTGPGNPWLITTLWLTEYEIKRAASVEDLAAPLRRLQWVRERANRSGLLAEQYDPISLAPISVTPLVWSHAQYAITFLAYTNKLKELHAC
jgi:GH15 family glucan-1,4-alpha-glucosidase